MSEDISRRAFNQLLGAAALSAALPDFRGGPSLPNPSITPPSMAEELCNHSAGELASLIRTRQTSSREVVAAHLARIERVNPSVNAVVTLVADRALADASRADEAVARGDRLGPLHGVPVIHKDLIETAGIRTTFGSPFYRDNVPAHDALIVERVRAAGAITLGKSNTPEFGAGSQTFNTVFGATRNPYDTSRTCGGSSGGSAVALACGMTPVATGTDFGGSLRNPAAFCNVVGLRPSPGRVPVTSGSWSPISVSGPMARTVSDVALFLSTMAGPDARDPFSIDADPSVFATRLDGSVQGARVAWWRGLGGIPFEPDVRRVVDANRAVLEQLGCTVHDDEPDFSGVDEALPILRHLSYSGSYAALAKQRPEWIKDTIHWEIDEAQRNTGADVARAMARQAHMYEQSHDFFQRYDYFVLPVTQVMPFDVTTPYPTTVAGVAMPTYIDWMRSCWYVSFMSNPAISVPAGFANGLPVGLQIVAPHRGDWNLLRLACAFEQATKFGQTRPKLVTG